MPKSVGSGNMKTMEKVYNAISIVRPNGTKIANSEKTIEVRSWKPTIPLNTDLLIVENQKYLEENDTDEDGRAIALVKIKSVRPFTKDDIKDACTSYWAEGYFSWELYDIRPINLQKTTIAKRGIYKV